MFLFSLEESVTAVIKKHAFEEDTVHWGRSSPRCDIHHFQDPNLYL